MLVAVQQASGGDLKGSMVPVLLNPPLTTTRGQTPQTARRPLSAKLACIPTSGLHKPRHHKVKRHGSVSKGFTGLTPKPCTTIPFSLPFRPKLLAYCAKCMLLKTNHYKTRSIQAQKRTTGSMFFQPHQPNGWGTDVHKVYTKTKGTPKLSANRASCKASSLSCRPASLISS